MADQPHGVVSYIPILRRHARLLTGSSEVGDEYVRLCLELIAAEPKWLDGDDLRVQLFRAFHVACLAVDGLVAAEHAGEVDGIQAWLERGLDSLSAEERRVLLLAVVEDFSLGDVGRIVDLPDEAVHACLARARQQLNQQVRIRVLIIEDEPMIAMRLGKIVREMGFSVTDVTVREPDAIAAADNERPGLVLADLQLQDLGCGITAAQEILERYDVPIVFVTGFPERLLTGGGHEPAFVVAKPFKSEGLKATIFQALSTYAAPPATAEHRSLLLRKLRQITASNMLVAASCITSSPLT